MGKKSTSSNNKPVTFDLAVRIRSKPMAAASLAVSHNSSDKEEIQQLKGLLLS